MGVIIALAAYHFTKSLSTVLLLGALFALTTIGLIGGPIIDAKKDAAIEA